MRLLQLDVERRHEAVVAGGALARAAPVHRQRAPAAKREPLLRDGLAAQAQADDSRAVEAGRRLSAARDPVDGARDDLTAEDRDTPDTARPGGSRPAARDDRRRLAGSHNRSVFREREGGVDLTLAPGSPGDDGSADGLSARDEHAHGPRPRRGARRTGSRWAAGRDRRTTEGCGTRGPA